MRTIKFGFHDVGPFDGYTDGSVWNGFINVWVDVKTHAAVIAAFRKQAEGAQDFEAMRPDADGRYCYANGFSTEPWRELTVEINRPGETPGYRSHAVSNVAEATAYLLDRVDDVEERGILRIAVALQDLTDSDLPWQMATVEGTVFYIEYADARP